METLLSDWIKLGTMTPLQMRVAGLLVCPHCHQKRLRFLIACDDFRSFQCTKCMRVFLLNPDSAKEPT